MKLVTEPQHASYWGTTFIFALTCSRESAGGRGMSTVASQRGPSIYVILDRTENPKQDQDRFGYNRIQVIFQSSSFGAEHRFSVLRILWSLISQLFKSSPLSLLRACWRSVPGMHSPSQEQGA